MFIKRTVVVVLIVLLPIVLFGQKFTGPNVAVKNADEHLVTINASHDGKHKGNGYFVYIDSTMTTGDSMKLALITPNGEDLVHLFWNIDATAKTFFRIKEGATVTSGDTVVLNNSNRDKANTSGIVFMRKVVSPISGTTLVPITLGASGAGKVGGESRSVEEIILKRNSKYTIFFVATAATVVNCHLDMYLHEEE